ncbi:MAG TPA: pitrilysin family protein [Terriglobales bacterium]|nr:pitrilysin family protein [Terriglobales bacterium]
MKLKSSLARTVLIAFLAQLCFGAAFAQQKVAPAKVRIPQFHFEKYKLSNGLEVILLEDHRLPLTAVNIWYHVGPANELPGRTGFAHLFEHMMFEGSEHVGEKAHFKYLEAAGASEINGTTDFDRTNYFETLPSNELEKALWLESDRMGFLLQTLDDAKLANQRDVVRNERRQSGEGQPYGLVEEGVFHLLYPKQHPYYANVIGSHADIEAARINDVRNFFKQYYTPNNATLVIVGDIDKAKSKQLVEKYFGPIPSGPPVPKITATTPAITSERRATITDKVELPRVYMAWITDPIFTEGDANATLAASILGGGKSSRLYKELVYKQQIAQDVTAFEYPLRLGSILWVQATCKPGVKPEALESAMNEQLDLLRKQGPTQAELERARNITESQNIRALERLGGFGGLADRLNQYNQFTGDPGYLPKDIAHYDAATTQSIQRLFQTKLANSARVVAYGVPGDKVVNDVPKTKEAEKFTMPTPTAKEVAFEKAQAWRSTPPSPAPASALMLPVPQKFKLENGLTVYVVENHALPVVSADLAILSGSEANPPDRPGLAAFTATMLEQGTSSRSAAQIADSTDQIGADLNVGSSVDDISLRISSLSSNTAPALDLISDLAQHPAFAPEEIERVRGIQLTSVLQQADQPNAIGTKVLRRVLYGDSNPYGYLEDGTEKSLKALQRDDVERFWKEGFTPGNSVLVLSGDLNESEARQLAQKYFGSWSGGPHLAQPFKVDAEMSRSLVLVDKPQSPQSVLRVGEIGLPRSSPDYVPVEVMNTMLGGLFSSRINMNLREKHGYTYGAFSRWEFRRQAGPFAAGASVRTDVTAPALKELLYELNRIRTEPLSADEIAMAKSAVARSLPGEFESTGRTARTISQLFLYDLPDDYYRTLPSKIENVSSDEVQRVTMQYIDPAKMSIVIVGDKAKIESGIKELNLGDFQMRDLQGDPVTRAAAGGS